MIRTLLLGLAFMLATTAPSLAGVNLMCEGEGIEADFPMGGGTGFSLLTAGVWLGDPETRRENDKGIVNGVPFQQSWVNDRISIDLANSSYDKVTVRVRLVSVPYYDAISGLIEVVDVGAFPVTCGVG
jgi:hypothetical protein